MAEFVPTTIIGVGSSGCKTVAWLSRLLYQQFRGNVPPIIRLIALDTDQSGISNKDLAASVKSLPISVKRIETTWTNLNQTHHIDSWFPYRAMSRQIGKNLNDGAGGVRAVGRLCLWGKWGDSPFDRGVSEPFSQNDLDASAEILKSALGVEEVHAQETKKKTTDTVFIKADQHHIYVVGSATGGTASGSLVDIVYALASKGVEDNPPKVIVLLTLPPETMKGEVRSGVNAAAVLVDLVEVLKEPALIGKKNENLQSVTKYPDGKGPLPTVAPPTAAVYLLGPSSPGMRYNEMVFECSKPSDVQEGLAMIGAYWLYGCLFAWSDVQGREADYATKLPAVPGDYPYNTPILRAFALGGAARPVWLLTELVTKRMLDSIGSQWVSDATRRPVDATQDIDWTAEGRRWMDQELDKELGLFSGRLERLKWQERVKSGESPPPPLVDQILADDRDQGTVDQVLAVFETLHVKALPEAERSVADLTQLVKDHVRKEVCDTSYSLVAAERFLDGVHKALTSRKDTWEALGIDCTGRPPKPEGRDKLLRGVAAGYESAPPSWLGGPGKRDLMQEVLTDLSAWMAAYYMAAPLFGSTDAQGGRSLVSAASELGRAVKRRKDAVSALQQKWIEREEEIVNLDASARSTIELVWFKEDQGPQAAADSVTNQLVEIQKELESQLVSLWEFLDVALNEQMSILKDKWTSSILLKAVSNIVSTEPLHQSSAASARVQLLLALSKAGSSRPYRALPGVHAVLDSTAKYRMTQADVEDKTFKEITGHRSLCRDLDLTYVEACGYTLFDLIPFRVWMEQLIGNAHEIEETDPYGGARRYIKWLSQVLVEFITDVLVERDAAGEPVGFWEKVDEGKLPFLTIQNGDIVMNLEGSSGSIFREADKAVTDLASHPEHVAMVLEGLREALGGTNRYELGKRWKVVSEDLPSRYSPEKLKLYEREFNYGINNPVGGLGHLVRN